MLRKILMTAAAAAALGAAGGAQAAVVTLAAHGTWTSGADISGLFYAPGTDLTGLAVNIVTTYDTTLAPAPTGGVFESFAPGWLSMYMRIDFEGGFGVMPFLEEGTDFGSRVALTNGAAGDGMAIDFDSEGAPAGGLFAPNEHISLDLGFANIFSNVTRLPRLEGEFAIDGHGSVFTRSSYCDGLNPCLPSRYLDGEIAFRTLTATTATVPEPATWALMIAGFGGAGAMLRRRRAGALAT